MIQGLKGKSLVWRLLVLLILVKTTVVFSFDENRQQIVKSTNIYRDLAKKYVKFKEDTVYFAQMDFNMDREQDVFVSTSNSKSYRLYLGVVKSINLKENKRNKQRIDFYRFVPGEAGQFFDEKSVVGIKETGGFGLLTLVESDGVFYKRLSYLNSTEDKLVTKFIAVECKPETKTCKNKLLEKFTTTSMIRDFAQFEEAFQYVTTAKEVLDKDYYQKLPSINESLVKNYRIDKLVNFNISSDVIRVFDKKTNEFLGYYDNSTKSFVSLEILKEHKIRAYRLEGPNFRVKERFGNKPVLRLKEVPEETPGSIVGGPLDKQIDVGGKLTDKPDEAQNKTDKVEKIVVEQKNKNGK